MPYTRRTFTNGFTVLCCSCSLHLWRSLVSRTGASGQPSLKPFVWTRCDDPPSVSAKRSPNTHVHFAQRCLWWRRPTEWGGKGEESYRETGKPRLTRAGRRWRTGSEGTRPTIVVGTMSLCCYYSNNGSTSNCCGCFLRNFVYK